jgi:hypothetical protein
LFAQQAASPPPSTPTLDYAFFKSRVQPIFLAKRDRPRPVHRLSRTGHAAASAVAHAGQHHMDRGAVAQELRGGPEGGAERDAEPLLVHPLEEDAGGDFYHSGGKHFTSQSDPEWVTLKAWDGATGQESKQ